MQTDLKRSGKLFFLSGLVMTACFAALIPFSSLLGPNVVPFLICFLIAGASYWVAVRQLERTQIPLAAIWLFAFIFRLLLLVTQPTLSDDVYRYLWDGHLVNLGINPYSWPVNAAVLDAFSTPLRQLVNHPWMASPYLPAAQLYFMLVTRLIPQSVKAFQVAAVICDLATGGLVMLVLSELKIDRRAVLIYLWNPLVIVEFAHAAHMDAWMICLIMLALYFLVKASNQGKRAQRLLYASALSLAAATLTKGLALMLAPLLLRRWGWRQFLVYGMSLAGACLLFALGAGWGLSGALDGRGLFGALRIYMLQWNYNGGVFHWLELWLAGYQQTDAALVASASDSIRLALRLLANGLLGLVVVATAVMTWRRDDLQYMDVDARNRLLARAMLLPLGAFILFTHTVHPWYVTMVVPFLPFLYPATGECSFASRFIWPWLYFSIVVGLSYLTYLNPLQIAEKLWVMRVEYIPFYVLLAWAGWPFFKTGSCLGRIKRQ